MSSVPPARSIRVGALDSILTLTCFLSPASLVLPTDSRPPRESYQMSAETQSKTEPRDSVLARFMLGFDGDSLPTELAEYLMRGLAGVVLYQRNFRDEEGLRELTMAIRKAAGRPVLIGIDQEGGTRFALGEPFTAWPSAAELGRLDDAESVEQVARAMAEELRAVGCNLNFAPMLDLHVNPESPVTKDRSFGSDPRLVAKLGAAFDRGLRSGGVFSCAKHFPGHGDAAVDPHLDLPVFSGTMQRLESVELVPFAAAVASGVPLVMTAHILLPQIDPENPASLSRAMLDGVLRRRLRFGGVILADDLGMGAIAKRYGPGEAALQTLRAGTDVAMLCHDWSAVAPAIRAVRSARQEGRFDEEEWHASIERIERVCIQAEAPGPGPSMGILGCQENRQLAAGIRAHLRGIMGIK
jgi:beta-N-acetylhexosaminidase